MAMISVSTQTACAQPPKTRATSSNSQPTRIPHGHHRRGSHQKNSLTSTHTTSHVLKSEWALVHRRVTTRAVARSSDSERPEPERADGLLRSFRASERLQGGNSPLTNERLQAGNSPFINEPRGAIPSSALWSEVVGEDEISGPLMTSSGRAGSPSAEEEEGPSAAELAKARWLVDREASVNEIPEKKRYSVFNWAMQPTDAMRRMREKLGGGEREAEGTGLYGEGELSPFTQKVLRKAERRGSSTGNGLTPSSPSDDLLRVPSSALFFIFSVGCAVAVVIGYRARIKFPFAGAALTAAVGNQVLGHMAVDEAPESDLTPVLADRSVLLRTAAANAFLNMQSEARSQGVYLLPLSGFRSVKDQQAVFFGVKASRNQSIRDRAKVSAPPGFSEHHTGYALDIGDACEPSTHLEFDFENTDAFHWLQSNANSFHFELSFPPNNEQGIMYEPWHWRFVGNPHATLTFYGSLQAQAGKRPSR